MDKMIEFAIFVFLFIMGALALVSLLGNALNTTMPIG
jgi:Tfp pilus assembly protein PilV